LKITYKITVLFCILGIVITGCGSNLFGLFTTPTPIPTLTPTPSQEQLYVKGMKPAIEGLQKWLDGSLSDWDKAKADHEWEFAFCVAYGISGNGGGCPENARQVLQPVLETAEKALEERFAIKSALGATTPPSAVKVAHEQISSCVEVKIQQLSSVVKLIQTGLMPSISSASDADPCTLFDIALKQVNLYIENISKPTN
jgi:hypothetical protein